ncbi:MAG: integrase arm-type DNA-binding domain-containing protein [Desulfovibrionaceae bacterium]|nr:integrase arm-type DNA-binding domain-containing protein [Desulfovibrionaceae bacterium]
MPLTDITIRNAKPGNKPYKLYDGGGLFVIVTPAGSKWWRFKYRYESREKLLSLGVYPAVTLQEARARRNEAKGLIAHGIDPSARKQAVKAAVKGEMENTFEIVAREWFIKNKGFWVDTHAEKILRRLENYIFPIIGGRPINQVTAPELLKALREVEAKGIPDVAHRALQNCSRIFRYAIATGRAERDTAADLRGALVPVKSSNLASIIDPKAIGALLRDIDAYTGNVIVRAALRMAPYVFVRPGELRRAEWAEFDLAGAEWRIPAGRMKMRQVHIVPLARQVISILEDLRLYTGNGRFLFPSMRANSAPISDVTLLAGLRRLGYTQGQMTVHGFRSMASTLLNEQGYNRDWIERQLAHGERNSIRAAYNYAEYLPERRRMMAEWAEYLDGLRAIRD